MESEPEPLKPQAETQDLNPLDVLTDELRQRSSNRPLMRGLAFKLTPDANAEVPSIPPMDSNNIDLYKLSLATDIPINFPVSNYEQWVFHAKEATSARGAGAAQTNLSHEIEREFLQLQREKVAEWVRQKEDAQLRNHIDDLMATVMRPEESVIVDTGKQHVSSGEIRQAYKIISKCTLLLPASRSSNLWCWLATSLSLCFI